MEELDLAALRVDLPTHGLIVGDVGTIVFVHGDHEAYEVEFVRADGRTIALETLYADQVQPIRGMRILHARELPATGSAS
ncbi:DUF4926 domain-containing protein [soil metagenome]|nr:DUF4926 domain-containing protein [Gemmatimonadota bacterium]